MATLQPKKKSLKGGAVLCNSRDKQKEGSEGESENTRLENWKRDETLLSHAEMLFRRVIFFGGFEFLLLNNVIFYCREAHCKIMAIAYKGTVLFLHVPIVL